MNKPREPLKELGLEISKIRVEQKMTPQELAVKSDVAPGCITDLENGFNSNNIHVTLIELCKVAKGLNRKVQIRFVEE